MLIVYKATNKVNGKIYIGQTTKSLETRKNGHIREAKSERKKRTYFHNAILKYGEENFLFEIIDTAFTQEELDNKERYWINFYNTTDRNIGYNLDSGGRTGGIKSDSTKKKIGLTTLLKWSNPETAKKMLDGLKKGTETSKKNAGKTKVKWKCPICGKTLMLLPHIAKNRKVCGKECYIKSKCWENGVTNSGIKNHQKNIDKKMTIKQSIIDWVLKNKEVVLKCPYNKITPCLSAMIDMLKEQYNIIDVRSIFICFDVKNKKQLLDKLKEIAISKENIC